MGQRDGGTEERTVGCPRRGSPGFGSMGARGLYHCGEFPSGRAQPIKHELLSALEFCHQIPHCSCREGLQCLSPVPPLFLSSPVGTSTKDLPRQAPGAASMSSIAFWWRSCLSLPCRCALSPQPRGTGCQRDFPAPVLDVSPLKPDSQDSLPLFSPLCPVWTQGGGWKHSSAGDLGTVKAHSPAVSHPGDLSPPDSAITWDRRLG